MLKKPVVSTYDLPFRKENTKKGQRETYGGAKLLGEFFFSA
jgi:hypothetical protein